MLEEVSRTRTLSINSDEYRQSFCDRVTEKISGIWKRARDFICCNSTRWRQWKGEEAQVPLLGTEEVDTSSLPPSSLKRSYAPILGLATSSIGIITSYSLLAPVIDQFVENCLGDLNVFAGKLVACKRPYVSQIKGCQASIGIFSGIFGVIVQSVLGRSYDPEDHSNFTKIRKVFNYLQNSCSYEIHIFLGCLYNGLWVDTYSEESWKAYFRLQTVAIGSAALLGGMYLYVQYGAIKEALGKDRGSFKINNVRANVGITSVALGSFLVSSITSPFKYQGNIKEISYALINRSVGLFAADFVERQARSERPLSKKVFSLIAPGMKYLPLGIVIGGYLIYIQSVHRTALDTFMGMAFLGIAMGIKEYYYKPPREFSRNEVELSNSSSCSKVTSLLKSYWPTLLLVGSVFIATQTPVLSCYSAENFDCPISLELSGDYINMDGDGVSISVISGLSMYYFREILDRCKRGPGWMQEVHRHGNQWLNRYQFEILTFIPYLMVNSGSYIKDYNAYASLNPPLLLAVVGISFGNYKYMIHSQIADPFQPAYTDAAALRAVII